MSDPGRSWLVALEGGCKVRAYLDSAGIPTIGVGMTYWLTGGAVRRRVAIGDRLSTLAQGLDMFAKALRDYESAVDAATRDDITQAEFDAFCSLAYNIGAPAFTRSTAVRVFNERADLGRVASAVRLWDHAGGKVDRGLVIRRECECDLILDGVYHVQGQTSLERQRRAA